jgi:acetyl esterase/lipase
MLHQTITLWDTDSYQSEDKSHFQPTLVTYLLEGNKTRGAVLICPGGGYRFTSAREAEPVAMQFNAAGFHAFVLYYSVAPNTHPKPLRDAAQAMNIIRNNAQKWHVDAEKIAVCGFSAGGHLAASLGVHWDKDYLKDIAGIWTEFNRPNALILCYAVLSAETATLQGSFHNLLGANASPELLREMSLEHHVTPQTAPTFLWHTYDDMAVPVEHTLLFANALREQNVPFELHVYPHGKHGLSLATKETDEGGDGDLPHVSGWMKLCIEWLTQTFEG